MNLNLLSEINYDMSGGNMINLPHDTLEKLNKDNKELPYFFELKTESFLNSYVGVREFTADKDTIQIPFWLGEHLGVSDGNQIIQVNMIENVPKGKYVKLRPESEDFFEVPEYESCLETKLSEFPLLYQGQKIKIDLFDKEYFITVEEIEQNWENFDFEKGTDCLEKNVINVIDTDLSVDINNIFLKKRLEEERKAKEEEILRQQKFQEELSKKRVEQKARIEENTESKPISVFSGSGNKLSDESNPTDIRSARLEFLEKRFKGQNS